MRFLARARVGFDSYSEVHIACKSCSSDEKLAEVPRLVPRLWCVIVRWRKTHDHELREASFRNACQQRERASHTDRGKSAKMGSIAVKAMASSILILL